LGGTFFKQDPHKFWDLDYKTEYTCHHVAKFHVDRPRELGDLAVKKKRKKNISSKTQALPLLTYRRPNKSKQELSKPRLATPLHACVL